MAASDTNLMFVFVCVIGSLIANGQLETRQAISPLYRRVCLIEQDSLYRPEGGRFRPDDVTDPFMCTHLVYGPALVDGDSAGLILAGDYDEESISYLVSLKASNPDLSVLLSVGGPDGGSQGFDSIINDTETGDRFVQNCLDFVRERSLDGILIDWSPTVPEDIQGHLDNFTALLSVMSESFKADVTSRNGFEVSVTMNGDRDTIETFYPVQTLAEYADFILVKTYDFYTADLPLIGHQSSLYPREEEEGYFSTLNLDFIVRFLLYLEVPSYKLIVGVPSHGRTLRFINESLQYFGADHAGPGSPGVYSQQRGRLAYFEICDVLSTGWEETYQDEHQVPFAFSAEEMVTYDNTRSVISKVNYVKDNQLGGLFVSSLGDDDYSGTFCFQGPFPLTNVIKTTLIQSRDNCYPGEYGSLDLPGCAPCPRGTFQSGALQTECNPCPSGYTTTDTGTKEPQDCLVDCGSGYEYSYMSESCDICPVGYIRDEQTHAHCNRCPVGMTTIAKGSSHCVALPSGMEKKASDRVSVHTVMVFHVESCQNEPLLLSAITQVVLEIVQKAASVWPSLCHQGCSNLSLDKHRGCTTTNGRRGTTHDGSLGLQARLDNVSLSTDNGQDVRLTLKVLEQAFYQQESFQPLEAYGVTFQGLDGMRTSVLCGNGSVVNDGHCDPCHPGTFHNTSSTACQKCPIGTYQDKAEMTSCVTCDGATSTVVSGAVTSTQCVSPCEVRPGFCHNGGICHWTEDDTNALHCQCFDGYSGDRCDVIADAYVDTGVIVGSSIGAVVALLLIVLIVVSFVTCVRYARVKNNDTDSSVNRKSSSQGEGRSSGGLQQRPAVSGKAYVVNGMSRGHRFADCLDYYNNWTYLSQNYFLPPMHHPIEGSNPSPLLMAPPLRPRLSYHSALPSPSNLSGDSKSVSYTGVV